MSCCKECDQKAATLGKLGWIPSGFGNVCVPGEPCGEYGPPPPLPATQVSPQLDATQVRALNVGGLLLNSLITAGGVGLWKSKHQVWGGLLVLLGGSGLALNVAGAVSGRPVFSSAR